MRWQRGPRPLAIRLFALAFLAAALIRLVGGLVDLASARQHLAMIAAPLGASDDAAIVMLSAEFTIALIPLVWIYGLGNAHARWLVLGFGALRLGGFAATIMNGGAAGALKLLEPALILFALGALLSGQARGWLTTRRDADAFSPD